jgi:hypothetical protein
MGKETLGMNPLAACLDVLACRNMVGILLLHLHNQLYNIEQDQSIQIGKPFNCPSPLLVVVQNSAFLG